MNLVEILKHVMHFNGFYCTRDM